MPKIVTDFAKDVPAELVVTEGRDAFSERGRGLLFIEMIGGAAADLASPDGEFYDETLAWVKDPRNLEAWLQIVDASPAVIPSLQTAFLERPKELKVACEYLSRSAARTGGSLERFMRAMGMDSLQGASSLGDMDEYDEVSGANANGLSASSF
ncbi:MAG: hypothetical protein K2X55_12055 [Burkholderiaceae bacterium]|nr:hypothetical protein [Burkholderiaceae bacterium]